MKKQNYYFTFGYGHKTKAGKSLEHMYIKLYGTLQETRKEIFSLRRHKWSIQYDEKIFLETEKYLLKEGILLYEMSIEDVDLYNVDPMGNLLHE